MGIGELLGLARAPGNLESGATHQIWPLQPSWPGPFELSLLSWGWGERGQRGADFRSLLGERREEKGSGPHLLGRDSCIEWKAGPDNLCGPSNSQRLWSCVSWGKGSSNHGTGIVSFGSALVARPVEFSSWANNLTCQYKAQCLAQAEVKLCKCLPNE